MSRKYINYDLFCSHSICVTGSVKFAVNGNPQDFNSERLGNSNIAKEMSGYGRQAGKKTVILND